jgi:hypothetical protein
MFGIMRQVRSTLRRSGSPCSGGLDCSATLLTDKALAFARPFRQNVLTLAKALLSGVTIFSLIAGCSRHESVDQLPSSQAPIAPVGPPPCPIRIPNEAFDACTLDPHSPPLCFHFQVYARAGGCVPGRATLAIISSARYQTDELTVATNFASGDGDVAAVELRLERMGGSQGFFKGPTGALVGTIHRNAAGVPYFELGPELLPSVLSVRTAQRTDVMY